MSFKHLDPGDYWETSRKMGAIPPPAGVVRQLAVQAAELALRWTVDGLDVLRTDELMEMVMKRITVVGAGLSLLVGAMAADAQVGYGPGVNPSNPQDLIGRSNPQDLTAPGGSNRQDLVRRPPGATSVVTPPPRTTTPRYTKKVKAKPKKVKAKPKPRRSTAPR